MFDNIGSKIKTLAKVLCWVGIAVSVLTGIILMIYEFTLYGLLAIVAGSLLSWVGSFVLYGFGQLVENSDIIAERCRGEQKSDEPRKPVVLPVNVPMNGVPGYSGQPMNNQLVVSSIPTDRVNEGKDDDFVDMYCCECGELLSFYRRDLQQEYQTCPMCGGRVDTRQYRRNPSAD